MVAHMINAGFAFVVAGVLVAPLLSFGRLSGQPQQRAVSPAFYARNGHKL